MSRGGAIIGKIDLFDAAFLADPHPTYRWLREHSPVHHLGAEYWLVSRHNVLRTPAVFSSALGYGGMMNADASALPGRDPDRRRALTDSGMGVLMRGMAGLRVLIATDPPDQPRCAGWSAASSRPAPSPRSSPGSGRSATGSSTTCSTPASTTSPTWEHIDRAGEPARSRSPVLRGVRSPPLHLRAA